MERLTATSKNKLLTTQIREKSSQPKLYQLTNEQLGNVIGSLYEGEDDLQKLFHAIKLRRRSEQGFIQAYVNNHRGLENARVQAKLILQERRTAFRPTLNLPEPTIQQTETIEGPLTAVERFLQSGYTSYFRESADQKISRGPIDTRLNRSYSSLIPKANLVQPIQPDQVVTHLRNILKAAEFPRRTNPVRGWFATITKSASSILLSKFQPKYFQMSPKGSV